MVKSIKGIEMTDVCCRRTHTHAQHAGTIFTVVLTLFKPTATNWDMSARVLRVCVHMSVPSSCNWLAVVCNGGKHLSDCTGQVR